MHIRISMKPIKWNLSRDLLQSLNAIMSTYHVYVIYLCTLCILYAFKSP